MPHPLDPANLEGDDLDRWYRRSPQEIEAERQAVADRSRADFFDGLRSADPDPGLADTPIDPAHDSDADSGFSFTQVGPNRWRAVRTNGADSSVAGAYDEPSADDPTFDARLAAPGDGEFIDVGNPHNRRLRREWTVANQRPWPKTDDGRNFHVAHRRAIVDGGTNTLDNIEPMHPDEHLAQHVNNGDTGRWGRRASIARAFGGTVEPPTPGLRANSMGLFGIFSDITGVLSGRIRTDTPMHFWYDMAGAPAPDDSDQANDALCRAMGVTEPGSRCT
jgi:hypothetical protein